MAYFIAFEDALFFNQQIKDFLKHIQENILNYFILVVLHREHNESVSYCPSFWDDEWCRFKSYFWKRLLSYGMPWISRQNGKRNEN